MDSVKEIRLLKLHKAQKEVLKESKRFNVLRIGRRWGKTELAKDLAINTMLDNDPIGYWTPTYKDLAEIWNEMKHTLFEVTQSKNEQLKSITILGGGKIDFWSMEDPNSGRGRKYKRVIIDEAEKARNFQEAWGQAIRPTLADLEGDCWILSTPKGKKTFFTQLTEYPKKYDNWASWTLSTYTNPYISKDELEIMKSQMNDHEFRQEIMAESLDQNAMAFCFNFTHEHIGKTTWRSDLETYLSFDFNREPLTCIVAQKPDFNKLHVIEEIVDNIDIEEMCKIILIKYPNALFIITGDQTGEHASAIQKGLTYYRKIKDVLSLSDNQVRLPGKNPLHRISRMEVNTLLSRAEIIFDEENCKQAIWDCKNVEYDPEKLKIVKEDRSKMEQQSDLLDCFRYLIHSFMRDELKHLGL